MDSLAGPCAAAVLSSSIACSGGEAPVAKVGEAPPAERAGAAKSVEAKGERADAARASGSVEEPARPAVKGSVAPADLAALEAMLRACDPEAGHPLGTIAEVEALELRGDERVFLARMREDAERRVLLFEGADAAACGAFTVGEPVAKAAGDWLGDGAPREAILLSQAGDGVPCDDDACPVALVVRDAGGAIVLAARPGLSCSSAGLAAVRLFDGRDSIELRCTTPGGTDAEHKLWIGHAFDRALRPVLAFTVGVTEVSPRGDDEVCTREVEGSYRVKTTGATPAVEVVEVKGLREGSRATWTFSPAEQRLVAGKASPAKLPAPVETCAAP